MEDFEKKVKITEAMDIENGADSSKTLQLLRRFLQIQQRRAQAYANMRRYPLTSSSSPFSSVWFQGNI